MTIPPPGLDKPPIDNSIVIATRTPDGDASSKWRNIEPILKWTAVAYALGFLTVMWHTHKIKVPVLQLTEPVNVWIGAPLAIVLFFSDKLLKVLNKIREDFVTGLREAQRARSALTTSSGDLENLMDLTADLMSKGFTLIIPFVNLLPTVRRWLKTGSLSALRLLRPEQGSLRVTGVILNVAEFVALTSDFMNRAAWILFIPLLCWIYVDAIYPIVPQQFGGGRPVLVQLIVPEESIPEGEVFKEWGSSASNVPPSPAAKHSILVPALLHFRTDHEFYVQRYVQNIKNGSIDLRGPIVSLSDHAVEGIIYKAADDQQNLSTTQPAGKSPSPQSK